MKKLNRQDYIEIAKKIFGIDSPTGFTHNAVLCVEEILDSLSIKHTRTNKGNIKIVIEGIDNKKTIATSAHLDTLGLMVRSILPSGELKVTNIGGPILNTLDGEYCKIYTREGKVYTGTILCEESSKHVYPNADNTKRDLTTLIVRLDEMVHSRQETESLGIQNGDFICYDPKFQVTESGYMKSRFIDDKGSVCAILTALKYMKEQNILPYYKTIIYFTVYEEVGHGCAFIDESIQEFVTVDMGCIGLDLNGSEECVSICCKDSSGPYDYELTSKLIQLAKKNDIPFVTDVFPLYSSDVSAAYRGGNDFKGALIGPGVANSHGMERTHMLAIEGTISLIIAYLKEK